MGDDADDVDDVDEEEGREGKNPKRSRLVASESGRYAISIRSNARTQTQTHVQTQEEREGRRDLVVVETLWKRKGVKFFRSFCCSCLPCDYVRLDAALHSYAMPEPHDSFRSLEKSYGISLIAS